MRSNPLLYLRPSSPREFITGLASQNQDLFQFLNNPSRGTARLFAFSGRAFAERIEVRGLLCRYRCRGGLGIGLFVGLEPRQNLAGEQREIIDGLLVAEEAGLAH